jgi:hypothetical protein
MALLDEMLHEHFTALESRKGTSVMYTLFIIDSISAILLIGALFVLWKERSRFYSLKPLIPAVVFLAIGRISDMLAEHPDIRLSEYFGMSLGSLEPIILIVGNISDTLGIIFLVYGFIKIIKYERTEEKHIQELEKMLPLCANCKKYRTEEGQWLPIEKYLIDSGAPKLTHGICPECHEKLYGNILKKINISGVKSHN